MPCQTLTQREGEQEPRLETRSVQTLSMASRRVVAAVLKRCKRVTGCRESGYLLLAKLLIARRKELGFSSASPEMED